MDKIWSLEVRKDEMSTVTKFKAPELMRAMEDGFSTLAPKSALIAKELSRAENAIKHRRAVVLLEVVPEYEKNKGGRMSADQREALVVTDPEYMRILDIKDQLESLNKLLRDKMDGFRMAFSAIKKIYDSLMTHDGTNL